MYLKIYLLQERIHFIWIIYIRIESEYLFTDNLRLLQEVINILPSVLIMSLLLFIVLILNACILKQCFVLASEYFSLFWSLYNTYQRVCILLWLVLLFLMIFEIHPCRCVNGYGIFSATLYSVSIAQFHLPVPTGDLGCFRFFAFINNAAMSIYGHVSFCTHVRVSLGYPELHRVELV